MIFNFIKYINFIEKTWSEPGPDLDRTVDSVAIPAPAQAPARSVPARVQAPARFAIPAPAQAPAQSVPA
jgi:hypothetical protein